MQQLLLDTELSSTQKDYAQTAQACGEALITLINEVLDRAKIEAGKLELEAVPFDLRSILDDVLSLFSEKSRRKGVEVSLQSYTNPIYHKSSYIHVISFSSLLSTPSGANLFITSVHKIM